MVVVMGGRVVLCCVGLSWVVYPGRLGSGVKGVWVLDVCHVVRHVLWCPTYIS
jgi:hypothetical protein